MNKKILAIGLILAISATVFMCGCVEEEYSSSDSSRAGFSVTYPVQVVFVFGEDDWARLTLYGDDRVFIESDAGSGYGTWQLQSGSESRFRYTVYDPDGETCIVAILSNGEAIFNPETDNIRGNWE
ncbi:MAG: hypothetical protein WBD09_08840 [Halobacteriota archaeon]